MKNYTIETTNGPVNKIIQVAGDGARIDPDGSLAIKAGDATVFTAAPGRWNYYQVQTHNIEALASRA